MVETKQTKDESKETSFNFNFDNFEKMCKQMQNCCGESKDYSCCAEMMDKVKQSKKTAKNNQ